MFEEVLFMQRESNYLMQKYYRGVVCDVSKSEVWIYVWFKMMSYIISFLFVRQQYFLMYKLQIEFFEMSDLVREIMIILNFWLLEEVGGDVVQRFCCFDVVCKGINS